MSRYLVPVVFTLLVVACSRKPAEVATPKAVSRPLVVASAATAPAKPPRKELDAMYKRASDKIDSWDGDGAVLVDARKDVLALLARDDQYAPGYAALARIEYRRGYIHGFEYEEEALTRARKLALHAVKLDPSCFDCHHVLANIRTYSGDFDLARKEIARMRELRPGSQDATLIDAQIIIFDGPKIPRIRTPAESRGTSS